MTTENKKEIYTKRLTVSDLHQLNLSSGSHVDVGGWIHIAEYPGPYGSTIGNRTVLARKPTLDEFRRDDFQVLCGVPYFNVEEWRVANCPDKFISLDDILGTKEEAIQYVEGTVDESLPYFNMPRVREVEKRWVSAGRPRGYFDDFSREDKTITLGIDIVGRVDSLCIFPHNLITFYAVYINGEPVFKQTIPEATAQDKLPFALLLFEDGKLQHIELKSARKDYDRVYTESVCNDIIYL